MPVSGFGVKFNKHLSITSCETANPGYYYYPLFLCWPGLAQTAIGGCADARTR